MTSPSAPRGWPATPSRNFLAVDGAGQREGRWGKLSASREPAGQGDDKRLWRSQQDEPLLELMPSCAAVFSTVSASRWLGGQRRWRLGLPSAHARGGEGREGWGGSGGAAEDRLAAAAENLDVRARAELLFLGDWLREERMGKEVASVVQSPVDWLTRMMPPQSISHIRRLTRGRSGSQNRARAR